MYKSRVNLNEREQLQQELVKVQQRKGDILLATSITTKDIDEFGRLETQEQELNARLKELLGTSPERASGPEQLEHGRVRGAVDEAVRRGILREQVFYSENTDARHGYLLLSPHLPLLPNQEVKPADLQAQAQDWQFVHLLERHGATSPIVMEGRRNTGTVIPRKTFDVIIGKQRISIQSPECQRFLFENPHILQQIMLQHYQQMSQDTPGFEWYATYPHFHGAHSSAVFAVVAEFKKLLPTAKAVDANVAEILFGSPTATGATNFAITPGKHPSTGAPLMRFGNGEWVYAQGVFDSMIILLKIHELFERINLVREEETAQNLMQTAGHHVPMAWAGTAHGKGTLPHLPSMHIHVLSTQAGPPWESVDIKEHPPVGIDAKSAQSVKIIAEQIITSKGDIKI